MNQFSACIAGILEIAVFAGGLITLYFGNTHKSLLLKAAAWVMIIGSLVSLICTSHFWCKYYFQGDFERANVVQITQPKNQSVE